MTIEQPEVQPIVVKADNQPDDSNANGGGSGQADTTFSQAQVDVIVKDRLGRAEKSTTSKLLETLGVEDIATAAKAIKDAEATKLAQMSELEKAQADIAMANEAVVKMQAEMDATRATATEALFRAAVLSAAAGFNDPNDAWLHIDKGAVEVQSDGTYKGIDEAVKTLAKSKPYLVKPDGVPNLGTPTNNKKILKSWSTPERDKKELEPERPNISF